MARMNVIFKDDLLAEIRELVPVRQRSEFIEDAVRSRLALLRQEAACRAAFGAWSNEDRASPEQEIRRSRESWSERADRLGINTAIVPRRGYEWLVEGLAKLPGWALVYVDAREAVFVREMPEHARLIAEHRLDAAELAEPRE